MNRRTPSLRRLLNYLAPVMTLALALVLLLWTAAIPMTSTARGNLAGLFLLQALGGDVARPDATRFLVGDFAVSDPVAMDKAVALWDSNADRMPSYLYMLTLYALGQYDDALATLGDPLATPGHPLEGMVWGHTQYALGEITRAGEIWRAIGFDFPMQLEANRVFRSLQFDNALPLYQRL